MSLLEVLQLVGYSAGAVLTLWMSVLLIRQRRGLEPVERVLLALAVCIGLWHSCNLFITLHRLLVLDVGRWSVALRLVDSLAVASITVSYSLLLHVHLHLWARSRNRPFTWFERVRVYLSYVPAVFIPFAVWHVWRGAYAPMIEKLTFFVLPFGVWAAYVLALIAVTGWLIGRDAETPRERLLMRTLAASFVGIGAMLVAAYALGVGRGTEAGYYLQTLANLGSLLPTALIAYHIYRYRYLELIIRESLVVATFAAVVLVVYLYVIRTLSGWLTDRYSLRAGVIETLFVLAFALVFAPLRAWLERRFHKLFQREATLYRDVVARIGAGSGRRHDLAEFLRFVAERTAAELGLRRVEFRLRAHGGETTDDDPSGSGDSRDADSPRLVRAGNGTAARDDMAKLIEDAGGSPGLSGPLLRSRGFEAAYPLRLRDGEQLGVMLVDASREALTEDARAVLEVLAGQVAIVIEDHRLIEENLQLERRLAEGERLAALGRMAATVAHEVKNPLSAIKSIAQVMREDERLAGNFDRDLELIIGETDRLSGTVSQLLSFARRQPPAAPPARADELTCSTVELFRAQAQKRGVVLECRAEVEDTLDGQRVTALRDALSNLVLNAVQATPRGGAVRVECAREGGALLWAVVDTGPGVADDLAARVWEPFFTTRQRGTGLGLAIVRKRVEEAGGSARLAPRRAGEGARFEIRLPLDAVSDAAGGAPGHSAKRV
ncbi:MAG TPA: ATP-binding protein [Pyrinomonadaceae bacterium]|nr:ATP-binding protein [Pyrinomonadaceae bacterium]